MCLGGMAEALSRAVPDWSGGTKIGASLCAFLDQYGGLVDRHTVVLIMSDGWDTGEIELLEDSMDEIQRRARCLRQIMPRARSVNGSTNQQTIGLGKVWAPI